MRRYGQTAGAMILVDGATYELPGGAQLRALRTDHATWYLCDASGTPIYVATHEGIRRLVPDRKRPGVYHVGTSDLTAYDLELIGLRKRS